GYEFLRQRKRSPMMINRGARNAADRLARAQAPEKPRDFLGGHAPPICVHRDLKSRVSEDTRRPLNGVDLRGKSGNNQARLVENLVARPVWILFPQAVTHRIMLASKQGVQQS